MAGGRFLQAVLLAAALASGSAPAAADEATGTIVLGAAVSLTGKYATNGQNTQKGYDLAVATINAAGGVTVAGQRYDLAVTYYDDESTPARGAQLAERLIEQDGVRFMLGPYSSGLTMAMAPVTEGYGVPMVEANGSSLDLFNKGYRHLFAVLSPTQHYLKSAMELAADVARNAGRDPASLTLAMAFEDDPFSLDIRTGVIADSARLGFTIVIDDKLPPDLDDMTATLVKVRALKPDILVISGHDKGAVLAVRQIEELRIDVPLLALTQCDSADIIGKFGAAAEDALCAAQWAPTLAYRDDLFGSAADFAALFQATYGYVPPYQAAESAAAVMVFADAFQRAGSLDQEAVRDALAATDLDTFYGPIRFDETGKNVVKPMVLYQVQDGAFVVVAPQRWAEGTVRWPRPLWSQR